MSEEKGTISNPEKTDIDEEYSLLSNYTQRIDRLDDLLIRVQRLKTSIDQTEPSSDLQELSRKITELMDQLQSKNDANRLPPITIELKTEIIEQSLTQIATVLENQHQLLLKPLDILSKAQSTKSPGPSTPVEPEMLREEIAHLKAEFDRIMSALPETGLRGFIKRITRRSKPLKDLRNETQDFLEQTLQKVNLISNYCPDLMSNEFDLKIDDLRLGLDRIGKFRSESLQVSDIRTEIDKTEKILKEILESLQPYISSQRPKNKTPKTTLSSLSKWASAILFFGLIMSVIIIFWRTQRSSDSITELRSSVAEISTALPAQQTLLTELQSQEQQAEPTAQQAEPTAQQAEPTVQQAEPTAQQAEPTAQEPSVSTFEILDAFVSNPDALNVLLTANGGDLKCLALDEDEYPTQVKNLCLINVTSESIGTDDNYQPVQLDISLDLASIKADGLVSEGCMRLTMIPVDNWARFTNHEDYFEPESKCLEKDQFQLNWTKKVDPRDSFIFRLEWSPESEFRLWRTLYEFQTISNIARAKVDANYLIGFLSAGEHLIISKVENDSITVSRVKMTGSINYTIEQFVKYPFEIPIDITHFIKLIEKATGGQ